MIHVAICDDEKEFVSEMRGLIERYSEEKQNEIRISSFANGLELMEHYDKTIDLIFLDIQMKGMDGLKAAEKIWIERFRNKNPHIVVTNDSGTFKVMLNTLHYVETYKRNLLLHTDDGEVISYKNMKELEKELVPYGFYRCHVGFLVNMEFVKRVEKLNIELTSGETIYASKPKKKEFMEAMAEYWGKRL